MSSLLSRTLEDVKEQAHGQPRNGSNSNNRPRRSDTASAARHSPYARPRDDEAWSHDMYERKLAPTAHTHVDPFAGQRRGHGHGVPSAKLKITNVNYEISERELKALFGQIGPISAGPMIVFDASGRSTGVAFVTYSDEKSAEEALHAFQGAPCKGDKIHLEYDYFLDNKFTRGKAAPGTLLARLDDDKWKRSKDDMVRYAPPSARLDHPSNRYARGPGAHSSSHREDRGSNGSSSSSRGARGVGASRGGRGGAAGSGGVRAPRREPKTVDDLDRELDSYLKQADSEPQSQVSRDFE
ncbi:BQ2448_4336 [Microbotryum intermedium]|uniref:BQ2448_4336 protein n=1 Tax=Microbotryum intermedium TaxID=269621 RepID=A0A238FJ29_9BASI|nr:BQ2448_4336 [Microbotryum intermedium]